MVDTFEVIQAAIQFGHGCPLEEATRNLLRLGKNLPLQQAYGDLLRRIVAEVGDPFADHPDAIGLEVLSEAIRTEQSN